MNNFKKIGLTALAGSLIATSAFAGSMSVGGSAGIGFSGSSNSDASNQWSSGDSLTFTGTGELDNGMTVTTYQEIDEEKVRMMQLKADGEFDKLTQYMKEIVHVDLRMLDRSDFVVVYIDMNAKPFGTIWELQNSLHQRKPTLVFVEGGKTKISNWIYGVMNHNYIFDSMRDLLVYLNGIDSGDADADLTRWVFFD